MTSPNQFTLHQPHNSLSYLTQLDLFNEPQANQYHLNSIRSRPLYAVNESHRSILSVVGKFCPALSALLIHYLCFRKMDAIKLVVREELADNLFFPSLDDEECWSSDSNLAGLRIPAADFLNPLCFTLGYLKVFPGCSSSSCQCYSRRGSFPEPGMTFVLRHLIKLEEMNLKREICCTDQVVKHLYKAQRNPSVQAAFERDCREVAQRVGMECSSSSSLLLPGI